MRFERGAIQPAHSGNLLCLSSCQLADLGTSGELLREKEDIRALVERVEAALLRGERSEVTPEQIARRGNRDAGTDRGGCMNAEEELAPVLAELRSRHDVARPRADGELWVVAPVAGA